MFQQKRDEKLYFTILSFGISAHIHNSDHNIIYILQTVHKQMNHLLLLYNHLDCILPVGKEGETDREVHGTQGEAGKSSCVCGLWW